MFESAADFLCLFCRYKFGKGAAKSKRIMPGYSIWVNLLDYSAAVLPVTVADKNVDVVNEGYEPLNETDEKVWEACKFCCPCSDLRSEVFFC